MQNKANYKFILFVFLQVILASCKNNEGNYSPNFHFYNSYGYEKNTPFNYIAFKKDHIYIMKQCFSFFDESVIEIPLKKDKVNPNKFIYNLCYYKFDISTFNGEFEKRSYFENSNNSIILRNIVQYIFEYKLTYIPDFEGLDEFDEIEYENFNQTDCLSYIIYSPNTKKTYWIKSKKKFPSEERKILNWLKFVTNISFVDAMYYDRLVGVYDDDDFYKYPKQKNYVISSKYWEKK